MATLTHPRPSGEQAIFYVLVTNEPLEVGRTLHVMLPDGVRRITPLAKVQSQSGDHLGAYSINDVIEITGLSRSTIGREIDRGNLVARRMEGRIKGRVLILYADLVDYLERLVASSGNPGQAEIASADRES